MNAARLPSNRSFGLTFTVAFALLAAVSWWRHPAAVPWLAGFSALFLAVTLIRADWLLPLNRAWMRFGLLLNAIVSPIVLGVLFFGVFTPVGLLMRAMHRDPMRRKWDAATRSYWIARDPPGPSPESLRDQF
jgi:hypothetical protein